MRIVSVLTWRIKCFLSAFGWSSIVAIFFMAGSMLVYFFMIIPLHKEIYNLKIEEKKSVQKSKILSSEIKTLNSSEQLFAFYQFFPTQDLLSSSMEKIYEAATEQGVVLERGDYQLGHERNSKLIRYDIAFPIKGGYLQVRKFIAQVLSEVPSTSLDSIVFNRDRINDPSINVQLKFSLYLRPS